MLKITLNAVTLPTPKNCCSSGKKYIRDSKKYYFAVYAMFFCMIKVSCFIDLDWFMEFNATFNNISVI